MDPLLTTYQMTKPAAIVWPHLVQPKRANPKLGSEPRYEATFLFPEDHPDFGPIKAALAAAVKAKFGSTDGRKFPLSRGDKEADDAMTKGKDREFLRGFQMFRPHSNTAIKTGPKKGDLLQPPRLVVLQNGKYVRYWEPEERQLAAKFFYSGVMAIGTFAFVAYEGMGGGVSAYLNEILSLGVGERINTGVDDEARYGAPTQYVGKLSAVDPTAGAEEIAY